MVISPASAVKTALDSYGSSSVDTFTRWFSCCSI